LKSKVVCWIIENFILEDFKSSEALIILNKRGKGLNMESNKLEPELNEILKETIDRTIELQFNSIIDTKIKRDVTESRKYIELAKNIEKTLDELKSKIPEDIYKSIIALIGLKDDESMLYLKYFFKQGVVSGLTDLSFLAEIQKKASHKIIVLENGEDK
jgi:hypothetical protein